MKRSRNLIISSLIALAGVTLASSVTGTLAWFQYSTSSSVAYTGTTVACSKLLKISNDNGDHWATDLVLDDSDTPSYSPVTSGAILKDGALTLHGAPSYLKDSITDWGDAPTGSYKEFTFQIKFADVSGQNEVLDSGSVYLTDLTITDGLEDFDLENAVRVHLDVLSGGNNQNHTYRLFSLGGNDTAVCGQLDLNNDGKLDQTGYAFQSERTVINYGGQNQVQKSFDSEDVADNNILLGSLNQSIMTIKVTIWIEGWALLAKAPAENYNKDASSSAVWDKGTYSAKDFHVGMTFGLTEN